MKLIRSFYIILCLSVLGFLDLYARETPPFKYYGVQDYNGGSQNWKITSNEVGEIFIANNEGVLLYDGINWKNLGAFNGSIVRSIYYKENRLYVGMYMEFGFYEEDTYGNWNYTSLSQNSENIINEDEQFWNILELGNQLIFQSLDQLIVYDVELEKLSILEVFDGISSAWVVDQSLYVQDDKRNLYKITGNEWILQLESKDHNNSLIVSIALVDNKLTLITEKGIFFQYSKKDVWDVIQGTALISSRVYSAVFRNNLWFIGTISDGIIVLDPFGKIIYEIGSDNGLMNNTVLAINGDHNGNIWLGLDNGIICINEKSNISTYSDSLNELGTVYTTAFLNDTIYAGTNVGLFYKGPEMKKFSKISSLNEQIWSLYQTNGKLLVGHNKGISVIEGARATPIHEGQGAWIFKPIPGTTKILVGTYKGFEIIDLELKTWQWKGKVEGFDLSSRFIEPVNHNTFLISHEYKGIYKVELSEDLKRVENAILYETPSKGAHSSIASFNDYIWYNDSSGLWKYDYERDQFELQSWYSDAIKNEEYVTGKMVSLKDNSLWFFKKERIVRVLPSLLEGKYDLQNIPILIDDLRPNKGFENIEKIGQTYILGGLNKYVKLRLPYSTNFKANILIQEVRGYNNETSESQKFSTIGNAKLPWGLNTISFTLGYPDFEVLGSEKLLYILLGHQENFTVWDKQSDLDFGNLRPGKYRLQFIIDNTNQNYKTDIYEFEVLYPWFMHPLMYLVYLISCLSILLIIHKSYIRFFKRKELRIHEENERINELKRLQIKQNYMHEKNIILEQQNKKNKKELANTLLHLSKNAEVLNELKSKSRKMKADSSFIHLIDEIDRNISVPNSWDVLEEAFNNVDEGFLSKLKELYPNLNSSDLRFCIHLRLNLTNREISSLYNISIKGVEIKRYRLRKKLGLTRDINLQDFIQRI